MQGFFFFVNTQTENYFRRTEVLTESGFDVTHTWFCHLHVKRRISSSALARPVNFRDAITGAPGRYFALQNRPV